MNRNYLLAFALGCALILSLGFTAQTPKPAVYEYKVLSNLYPAKDEQKINEVAAQGWELFYVVPTISAGTQYNKADMYFRRPK